jgi:hypothetical protein
MSSNNPLESSLELDSHANTTILGAGALIIQSYDRLVEFVGYDPQQDLQTFEMVSGILAFDHPRDGQVYHLVFHQAFHMPQPDHHLLCPMQCRINDVTVNNVPKFLTRFPTDNMHALIVTNPDDDSTTLTFPLHLQGVTSYLPVCKPTAAKWETGDIVRIDMMAENLDWDPNDPTYTSQEATMTDYRGVVLPRLDRGQPFVINTLSSMTTDAADITDDENFGVALEQHVTVSVAVLDTTKTAPGRIHSKAAKPVDAETLAKHWLIPANRAARTVDRMTRRGVCTMLNPTLSCRFPTNDCMLRYPRMPHPVFGDTMFAGTESKNGNKCCQVFATNLVGHMPTPSSKRGRHMKHCCLCFSMTVSRLR